MPRHRPVRLEQQVNIAASPGIIDPGTEQDDTGVIAQHSLGAVLDGSNLLVSQAHGGIVAQGRRLFDLQTRCATVVMTLAAPFISSFTGAGSSVAPARWASR
ncbi:hypothetical protein RZS08_61690, partial [Arthrospira platensis SPKY1]|nr:hypothetical protein [Arthrospira platensis SPKY1]